MSQLMWWGYLHTSGTVQLKRFFDERDIQDAADSPFVARIFQPFEASSREEAWNTINQKLSTNP